jgi:hypothetical protein
MISVLFSQVGFYKGDANTSTAFALSDQTNSVDIQEYSNVGIKGRIVTQVDGNVQYPGMSHWSTLHSINNILDYCC